MSIGTKKLVHIAFVVRDLDKVVDAWTKILGIERPRIWNIPGPDVAPVLTNGHPEIYTNCRISVIQLENVTLKLTQPGDEPREDILGKAWGGNDAYGIPDSG